MGKTPLLTVRMTLLCNHLLDFIDFVSSRKHLGMNSLIQKCNIICLRLKEQKITHAEIIYISEGQEILNVNPDPLHQHPPLAKPLILLYVNIEIYAIC